MVKRRFQNSCEMKFPEPVKFLIRQQVPGRAEFIKPTFSTGDVTNFFPIDRFKRCSASIISRGAQSFRHVRSDVKSSRFQNERCNR